MMLCSKYYLKTDKARTASFLNGLENAPFYSHLMSLFMKKNSK